MLYEITLKSENVALALNQKEFRETRGSSMSGRPVEINRIPEFYKEMGDWSRFIVDHFWPNFKADSGSGNFLFENTE